MEDADAQKIVKEELLNKSESPLFTSGEKAALSGEAVVSPEGLIQKALDAAKLLKIENDRREALMARAALSGNTEAGMIVKPKTKEEEITEAANRILRGTGYKV